MSDETVHDSNCDCGSCSQLQQLLARCEILPSHNLEENLEFRYPTLYKIDITGEIRQWDISWNGTALEILHGLVTGKKTGSTNAIVVNASGRSLIQQAQLEARQRYTLKKRKGYSASEEPAPDTDAPMLAQVWKLTTQLQYPLGVQPKLDGLRCLVRKSSSGAIIMASRGGVEFNLVQPYFAAALEELLALFPTAVQLDGELWFPEATSSDVVSLIKNPDKVHNSARILSYNIFTFNAMQQIPAETRWEQCAAAVATYNLDHPNQSLIRLVPMQEVNSADEILAAHSEFMLQGYEGTMIYKFGKSAKKIEQSYYKSGRSANILKYKDFEDSEAVILGVYSAKGNDTGAGVFAVHDPKFNATFGLAPGGSREDRKYFLEHAEEFIGKWVNYRYQGIDKNCPRFPVGRGIREDMEPMSQVDFDAIPRLGIVSTLGNLQRTARRRLIREASKVEVTTEVVVKPRRRLIRI